MKKKKATIPVKAGTGNVFADLGFANPEREQLKGRLTLQIYRLIKKRDLAQVEAGKLPGIKQPVVSSLMRGRSGAFSVERLIKFLTALGQDVEITVRPTRRRQRELSVVFA
jgi:predicted XRE-type DNA-binding protein